MSPPGPPRPAALAQAPVEHRLAPVQQVGGLHPEDAGQCRHLAHAQVADSTGPDALDVLLREIAQRHAGNLRVRVSLSRTRVPDSLEEVPNHDCDAAALAVLPVWHVAGALIEPRLRREGHGLDDCPQLLVSGVLYAALPEVYEARAGNYPVSRFVELLARLPMPIRPPMGVQQVLELLRCVHEILDIKRHTV